MDLYFVNGWIALENQLAERSTVLKQQELLLFTILIVDLVCSSVKATGMPRLSTPGRFIQQESRAILEK